MARETIRVKLPDGFDPAKHMAALAKLIEDQHGAGFDVEHTEGGFAVAVRESVMAAVIAAPPSTSARRQQSFQVDLPKDVKSADGQKWEARLEDQYSGFYLTSFDPYLKKATLTKLNDETARCRAALSVALGVKRWEVGVSQRPDGGFDVTLPRTYTPSRHDGKLEEVATSIVGREGWYVETNPAKLTASIIPADPPTFPAVVPYPMGSIRTGDDQVTRFGRWLPVPGEEIGEEAVIDWGAGGNVLVSGLPRAGKSVVLNAIIGGMLADDAELVIVDTRDKSVDYLWCKPWVRTGGWGCESLRASVAALGLVLEEGERRAGILRDHGVVNWLELPPAERFPPLIVILDELSGLTGMDKVPPGLPKKHPEVMEVLQNNLLAYSVSKRLNDIVAQYGFVGIRCIPCTQITNNNTGVSPTLKNKIVHRLLQGALPSETALKQAFADYRAVPPVPKNVSSDGKAARGIGSAEVGGHAPGIYKGYYASPDEYAAALRALGRPETPLARHEPTAKDVERLCPSIEDGEDLPAGDEYESLGFGSTGPQIDPETGEVLTGFAKANAARRQLDAAAGTARRKPMDLTAAGPVTVTRRADSNNPFDQSGQ